MRRKCFLVKFGSILLLQNICHAFVVSPQRLKSSISTFSQHVSADTNDEAPSVEKTPLQPLEDEIQNFLKASSKEEMSEARRIFHGRGDCYPGLEHLTLDIFPPVWLLTSHKVRMSNDTIESIQTILEQSLGNKDLNLVYQFRNDTESETRIMSGEVPKPHVVTENGMKFLVNLAAGQNHGIFLDMANGRK